MKLVKAFINYVLISLSLLFISLKLRAFSLNYFLQQFKIHHITEVTGKKEGYLREIAIALIKYLKKGDNWLLSPYFSRREVLHMVDVYHLFRLMYILQWTFAILIIALSIYAIRKRYFKKLWRSTAQLLSLNLLLLIVGYILFQYTDFTTFFIKFHEIFFSNDLWLMDPQTDLMIQMLPQPFFAQMALEIVIVWISLSIVLQIFILILWPLITKRLRQSKDSNAIHLTEFIYTLLHKFDSKRK